MSEATLTKVHQGFSYLLDPTPVQRQLLASHTGSARFCHNFLLGLVLENWRENRGKKEAGEEVTRENYRGTRQLDLQKLCTSAEQSAPRGSPRTPRRRTTTRSYTSPRPSPTTSPGGPGRPRSRARESQNPLLWPVDPLAWSIRTTCASVVSATSRPTSRCANFIVTSSAAVLGSCRPPSLNDEASTPSLSPWR